MSIPSIANITRQIDEMEGRLMHRFPVQKRTLWAKLCAWRWLLRTIYQANPTEHHERMKQVRLSLGQYWYNSAEAGEILTRLLCTLDNVPSQGNEHIRMQRKAQVTRIHGLLLMVDQMKQKGLALKTKAQEWLDLNAFSEHHHHHPWMNHGDPKDDTEHQSERARERDGETGRTIMDVEVAKPGDSCRPTHHISELPQWNPPYSVTEETDAICFRAALSGVDPEHISIQPRIVQGVGSVLISGFKFPTAQDLKLERSSRSRRYGRFVLQQPLLPLHLLDMSDIECRLLGDSILTIRIPKRRHDPFFLSSIQRRPIDPSSRVATCF